MPISARRGQGLIPRFRWMTIGFMHLRRDVHVGKHPQPIAPAWGFKYKYKMQCRGGGRQPIRPQGFSPASPAPPPPTFPSPNRPTRKAKCGSVRRRISPPGPRGHRGTRLPNGHPKRVFWGGVEGKRKGSGEGAGGARGKLLSSTLSSDRRGPYISSPSPRPHCICISPLKERQPANALEKCRVVIPEDCIQGTLWRLNNLGCPQFHRRFPTPVKINTHP